MSDTLAKIKQRAAEEYPNDYSMQAYEIDQQIEALNKLSGYLEQFGEDNEIANTCITKAMSDWPENYSMQLYEFEGQLNAANEFFPYENTQIPKSVLDSVKARVFQEWPGD
ncbi:hypothetical protein GVY41_13930 [Frigidibacter albus]|uniref:Uncharacterized protein n=1 Tax=Frigidibacter albus TaxID=1465486 RepID=A0A6L8VJB4_9RHOB|nr:hypothetical protein [Frigidibacter albus]MZQ90184.1 hypothetical protein [Frigidibacter albus]NBE32095.1 hypothetical protein [Frigidibacter albus]GGH56918.1 hypothetical protein GCM10011341_25850 [Frigidibacter albus]